MAGMSNPGLEGRNGLIWRDYCRGATQEALAEEHRISQAQVSRIISAVRAQIPPTDLDEARARHVDFLSGMTRQAAEIAALPPAQAYSNGRAMYGPDGEPVLDYSGKLKAMETAVRISERVAKILGMDAPAKIEHGLTDAAAEAAAQAASEAMSRLHGE